MKFIGPICTLAVLAACSPISANSAFDRPALLSHAPSALQEEISASDRHILVVRHARKVSPDCNALNCQLSPQGEAMVARLSEVMGPTPFDAAYASAACRTVLTAQAGGAEIVAHQAADGYDTGCIEGERISRLRSEAFDEARNSEDIWTIVGEHSNTTCLWLAEFAGLEASQNAGCTDGRLDHDAYGHIYWLYRNQGAWGLTRLEGAFEVSEMP